MPHTRSEQGCRWVFYLHPCHVANVGCGAKPHGVNKPLGGRVSRGYSVPKALILLGFLRLGIYANRRAVLRAGYALMPHLCTCSHVHKCSRIRGSVCPLLRCLRTARRSSNGLSYLTSFRWSVKASLWPLAEPFQPKLGFSLYERLIPIFTPSKTTPISISFLIERFTWWRFMPT